MSSWRDRTYYESPAGQRELEKRRIFREASEIAAKKLEGFEKAVEILRKRRSNDQLP